MRPTVPHAGSVFKARRILWASVRREYPAAARADSLEDPMRTRSVWLAALAVATISFLPPLAHAQLGTSRWSLELGTDLGSTSSFEFAVRRHSGGSTAFRLGISANSNHRDGDGRAVGYFTPADESATSFRDFHDVNVSLEWMHFATVRQNVSAVFATGPSVQLYRSYYRQGFGAGLSTFQEQEQRNDETLFGWEVALGAEWHFTSRLSLGGVAGAQAHIGTSHDIQIQRSGTGVTYNRDELTIKSDVTRMETNPARIYLSAYF
jgi:hypothetical protein